MSNDYYANDNFVVTRDYLYDLVKENMNSTLLLYKGHNYFIEPFHTKEGNVDFFEGHIEHYEAENEEDFKYNFGTFTELMDYRVHDGKRLEDVLGEMEQLE